jgi:hypothetical protein
MSPEIVWEYIKRRTAALKMGDHYTLRLRHFVLAPGDTMKIPGQGQFFLLVEAVADVSILSESGIFDMTLESTNELIYEHEGDMQLHNYAPSVQHIRFIQIIPNNKNKST